MIRLDATLKKDKKQKIKKEKDTEIESREEELHAQKKSVETRSGI